MNLYDKIDEFVSSTVVSRREALMKTAAAVADDALPSTTQNVISTTLRKLASTNSSAKDLSLDDINPGYN